MCCPRPRPHLQSDWAGGAGESSGPFVSLLSEETLLTSGTWLSIRTLDNSSGVTDTVRREPTDPSILGSDLDKEHEM